VESVRWLRLLGVLREDFLAPKAPEIFFPNTVGVAKAGRVHTAALWPRGDLGAVLAITVSLPERERLARSRRA
jgi:hypothetical protein